MLHQAIIIPDARLRARTAPGANSGVWLFLLLAAVFLYWDAANSPITLWDESRNIVSALEMRQTGLSLVTTYGYAPDLWNTKPPLLIWLIYASVELFGPTVWALRLPSMLASLGTLYLTTGPPSGRRDHRRAAPSQGQSCSSAHVFSRSTGPEPPITTHY